MSSDHFSLDVDLESLRAAQRWLGTMAAHLKSEAPKIGNAPDKLGSWTGPAATKLKAEMTNMGVTLNTFDDKFLTARDAVKTFADAVEVFKNETLPSYNTKWTNANNNAAAQIKKAEADLPEDEVGAQRGNIATGLRYTLQGLSYSYAEEKQALETKAKTLGTTLAGLTTVKVPDSVITNFTSNGGSGRKITWTDKDGKKFPPDLDANAHLGLMSISEDSDQQDAGEALAAEINKMDRPVSAEDAKKLADAMNSDSEAFRAGFINALDPKKLAGLHEQIGNWPTNDETSKAMGALLTAIAQTLSKGSRTENQTNYPVITSKYDDLVKAYTDIDDEYNPDAKAMGYLRLSELIAAGQLKPPTWDSDLLASITRKTIEYEQEQVKIDQYWSWGPAAGKITWTTKNAEMYDDTSELHNPYWGDPIVLYFQAMEHDTRAAQQVLTNGTRDLDQKLSEYLYGRNGHPGNYGYALSKLLDSATQPVGAGGKGTPEYISAAVVADMVGHYGSHKIGLNMQQGIVDILTRHVHAVNHAGFPFDGLVFAGDPKGITESQRINLAHLDTKDLKNLLTQVLELDYFSNEIAEKKKPPQHAFPLYTQLALAQELAAKNEVIEGAKTGDTLLLETLVRDMSAAQERSAQAFHDALTGVGRGKDQATADAQAALNFVLDQAKKAAPTSKLGPGGKAISSVTLDQVQKLIVKGLVPDTDYLGEAGKDVSLEEYRRQLTSLKLVKWLDEAGTIPDDYSPVKYAAENPEYSSFVRNGEMIDPGELYRQRGTSEAASERWNNFLRYYRAKGRPWLAGLDLDEQYTLGWLEAGG